MGVLEHRYHHYLTQTFASLASLYVYIFSLFFFFFQAEDGIRDYRVTGVQTCALPIRRHTRLSCDWSSDVCSSDLEHTSELQSHDNLVCAWSSDVCSRSEEHTSELQSHDNLVCRLLLENKEHLLGHCRGQRGPRRGARCRPRCGVW